MRFRRAAVPDVESIVAIIDQARVHLKSLGIDQWQGPYPDAGVMAADVEGGGAYVLDDGGRVAATVTVSMEREPSYDYLEGGGWRCSDAYAVIHRMAIHDDYRGRGVAQRLMGDVEKLAAALGATSIRTDTHPDNMAMQRIFRKGGYAFAGTVMFDGSEKLAYEKVVSPG